VPGIVHRQSVRTFSWWLIAAFVYTLGGSGCATVPYRYSKFSPNDELVRGEVVYEYGEPHRVLDGIAWATGIWSRVLSLNSHVNNHELTDETKAKLTAYLEENDLTDVLIRVNQYDPRGEWRRLRENRRVSPGWRYTAGLLSMAHYSLLPGRVLGGDQYNPFTNSLYLNSDVPAVVMHEAAYAKDVHSRSLPGSYAVLNELPVLSLWRHTLGVNEILGYARTNDDWIVERDTYRVVYPQMGIHMMALPGSFVPLWEGMVFAAGGAAAGHVTGRIALAQRTKERNQHQNELNLEETPESEPLISSRFTTIRSVSGIKGQADLSDEQPEEDADSDDWSK
jgi:hypothetical protein